jgi:hypothetical protein
MLTYICRCTNLLSQIPFVKYDLKPWRSLLQAEIGYADFGGACGACFHLAPPSCKRKATKEFV